jgi:hypothetical protein
MRSNSFVSRIDDGDFAPNILALLTTLGIAKKKLPSLMHCGSLVSRIDDRYLASKILALLTGLGVEKTDKIAMLKILKFESCKVVALICKPSELEVYLQNNWHLIRPQKGGATTVTDVKVKGEAAGMEVEIPVDDYACTMKGCTGCYTVELREHNRDASNCSICNTPSRYCAGCAAPFHRSLFSRKHNNGARPCLGSQGVASAARVAAAGVEVLQRLLDKLAKEGKAEKRERNLQSAPAANGSSTAAPAPKKQKVKVKTEAQPVCSSSRKKAKTWKAEAVSTEDMYV